VFPRRGFSSAAGGNAAKFQVRAWGGGYATYEEALLHNGVLVGQSAVFVNATGNPGGGPPTPPESLLAGTSFPAGGLQGVTVTNNILEAPLPVITCASNKVVNCTNAWSFDPPTAVDGCTGSNLPVAVIDMTTNGECPKFITCTWAATNTCDGSFASCSQTVLVVCADCPVLALTKSCPPYPVPPGGVLGFGGTVTNVGEITISNVVVVNDQPSPNTLVFGPATLLPGEGAAFSGSYNIAGCCGPYADTLTASGIGLWDAIFTSSVTAICPGTNYLTPGDLNGDGIVDQAELNAVLANYWLHSPWIYMTNAARLCDGRFQFELTNNSAWNFTVLVTTNFADWTNLPGMAYPVYQFQDPDGTNTPQRFYRLSWP